MKAETARMSQTAATVEVLVIGGGVIGSSIAYHIARQGRKVLVVERQEVAVEPVASWASAGGVTPGWGQHSPVRPSSAGTPWQRNWKPICITARAATFRG